MHFVKKVKQKGHRKKDKSTKRTPQKGQKYKKDTAKRTKVHLA
jgi:hypothetical protein